MRNLLGYYWPLFQVEVIQWRINVFMDFIEFIFKVYHFLYDDISGNRVVEVQLYCFFHQPSVNDNGHLRALLLYV